jgi:hypothetical protein
MARNSRVEMNFRRLNDLEQAVALGFGALAEAIVNDADPPDASPYGEGLVTTGAWGVWVGGRKVAGNAKKPRSVRVKSHGIVAVAGFGFPGRFQELGVVHHGPQPFLIPSTDRNSAKATAIIGPVVKGRL